MTTLNLLSLPTEILLYIARLKTYRPLSGDKEVSPANIPIKTYPVLSGVDKRLRNIALKCFQEVNQKVAGLVAIYSPPLYASYLQNMEKEGSPVAQFKLLINSLHKISRDWDCGLIPPPNLGYPRLQWESDNFGLLLSRIHTSTKKKLRDLLEESNSEYEKLKKMCPCCLAAIDRQLGFRNV